MRAWRYLNSLRNARPVALPTARRAMHLPTLRQVLIAKLTYNRLSFDHLGTERAFFEFVRFEFVLIRHYFLFDLPDPVRNAHGDTDEKHVYEPDNSA